MKPGYIDRHMEETPVYNRNQILRTLLQGPKIVNDIIKDTGVYRRSVQLRYLPDPDFVNVCKDSRFCSHFSSPLLVNLMQVLLSWVVTVIMYPFSSNFLYIAEAVLVLSKFKSKLSAILSKR